MIQYSDYATNTDLHCHSRRCCVGGLGLVVSLRPAPEVPTGFSPTPLPSVGSETSQPAAGQVEVSTARGPLLVSDVRQQPETVQLSDGVYAVFGENLQRDQSFVVTYYEFDQSYRAALLKEPLAESRRALERALQRRLGVSEEELCSLNVTVGVPVDINPSFASQSLGLSFCSGSVRLE